MKSLFFRINNKIHRFGNLLRSRAVILAYHRVANVDFDPQLLCVSPQNFADQLERLCKLYRPLSLLNLVKSVNDQKIRHKSVVITFDDGYRDNFYKAKEILEFYKVPATIFVTTNNIGRKQGFWWDELENIILLRKFFPDFIRLDIDDKTYEWEFRSLPISFANFKDWNVSCKYYPGDRFKFYKELHLLLKCLHPKEIERIIHDLNAQVGEGPCVYNKDFSVINHEQLRGFKSNFIDIGSHTVSHPMMSRQTIMFQEEEIVQSKKYLETIMHKEVGTFSYPFGGLDDIDLFSEDFIKKAGYRCAVANYAANVYSDSNIYKLPRYLVRNWDGAVFESIMKKWFHGE